MSTKPNEVRTAMIRLADYIIRQIAAGDQNVSPDTAMALAQRVLELDHHLTKGGMLPDAWRPPELVSGSAYLAPF